MHTVFHMGATCLRRIFPLDTKIEFDPKMVNLAREVAKAEVPSYRYEDDDSDINVDIPQVPLYFLQITPCQ